MKNTIKKSCIVIAACLMIVFGFASLAEEAGSAPSDDVNIEFEYVEDAIPEEIEIEVADVDEIGEEAEEQEFDSEEDTFREDEETLSAAEDAFWEDEESFSAIDAAAYVIDEIEDVDKVDGEETIVADSPAMGQVEGNSISGAIIMDIADQTYDGYPKAPSINVMVGNKTLVHGTDYTVEYTNNINAGQAAVTVKGVGNYTGTATKNFNIVAAQAGTATVTVPDQNLVYNGNNQEPGVTVTLNGKTLIAGTDYDVAYANNKNAGTATATVTFKGNYSGTTYQTFTIKKKTVTVSYNGSLDKVYDKTRNLRNVPESSFKFSGVVSGEEIQVLGIEGHYDSADVGTYSNIGLTVKIVYTDKDKTTPAVNLNYELSPNTCTASGKITPKTLTLKPGVPKSSRDSTLVPQTKVYGTIDPPMRAKISGSMSGDYSSDIIGGKLEREPGENVGKYKIHIGTVKGKGNYAEEVVLEEGYFEIIPKDISDADMDMAALHYQSYTGSPIEPPITLKYTKNVGGKSETETLVKGKDYDVTCVNNVEPGIATVTVTGKGNYTGTRTATFFIQKDSTTVIYVYVTNPTPAPAAPAGPSIPAVKKAGKTTITSAPGAVYQLDLGGASGKGFKSSKKKVAVVDGNGNVTIRGAGKTKITFKVGKKKRTLTLTVKDPTIPASVALNPVNTAVKVGESVALTPVIPDGTASGFKWKSSNKKVARVSNGVVTFRKPGKVTITCTCVRGKKKAKVTFRVSK